MVASCPELPAGASCRRGARLGPAACRRAPGRARTLEEAKAAGTIVVGIQGDNQPWGFIDSSGVQSGFDADIAKAFAEYLGVEVEFTPTPRW